MTGTQHFPSQWVYSLNGRCVLHMVYAKSEATTIHSLMISPADIHPSGPPAQAAHHHTRKAAVLSIHFGFKHAVLFPKPANISFKQSVVALEPMVHVLMRTKHNLQPNVCTLYSSPSLHPGPGCRCCSFHCTRNSRSADTLQERCNQVFRLNQ